MASYLCESCGSVQNTSAVLVFCPKCGGTLVETDAKQSAAAVGARPAAVETSTRTSSPAASPGGKNADRPEGAPERPRPPVFDDGALVPASATSFDDQWFQDYGPAEPTRGSALGGGAGAARQASLGSQAGPSTTPTDQGGGEGRRGTRITQELEAVDIEVVRSTWKPPVPSGLPHPAHPAPPHAPPPTPTVTAPPASPAPLAPAAPLTAPPPSPLLGIDFPAVASRGPAQVSAFERLSSTTSHRRFFLLGLLGGGMAAFTYELTRRFVFARRPGGETVENAPSVPSPSPATPDAAPSGAAVVDAAVPDRGRPDAATPDHPSADRPAPRRTPREGTVPPPVAAKKTEPRPPSPHRPTAAPSAAQIEAAKDLYQTGFQSLIQGNAAAAEKAFRDALRKNPRYDLAYRGLGLANEKLGKVAAARAAFTQYLSLRPDAKDAEAIRAKIAKLR
jgi:hypothetical protein